MSKSKLISRMLGIALVLGLALTAGLAISAGKQAGKITYLKGTVEANRGGAWTKLAKGSAVLATDVIRTGKKSRVEIVFADQSVIRLSSHAKVKINKAVFQGGGNTQFAAKMYRGQAYAVASKLVGNDATFKVETSNAVAGVRGTTFRIDAKRDKSTVVRVYTGAVAVSNAPIYAKPGAVKKTGKFQMPRKGVKPGGPGRVEVAGPHEVTKKEWEEFVAKAMQEVRVAADGKISEPIAFDSAADAADEWVSWNKSRDKQISR